jgi:hypothetical protein
MPEGLAAFAVFAQREGARAAAIITYAMITYA